MEGAAAAPAPTFGRVEYSSRVASYYERCNIRDDGTAICNQICRGNKHKAVRLIRKGFPMISPTVDVRGARANAALQLALEKEIDIVIEALLQAGAPVCGFDTMGYTPLHYARSPSHVKALLARGALFDVNRKGYLPIHLVAKTALSGENITALLALYPSHHVNAPSPSGTPLLIAVSKKRVGAVRALVAAGADPHATRDHGRGAVDLLLAHGYSNFAVAEEILRLLARAGALCRNALRVFTADQFTPTTLQLVLNMGANPNERGVHGSPLHRVDLLLRTDLVAVLLANGAHASLLNSTYQSPLHVAAEYYRICRVPQLLDSMTMLLMYGGDWDTVNRVDMHILPQVLLGMKRLMIMEKIL